MFYPKKIKQAFPLFLIFLVSAISPIYADACKVRFKGTGECSIPRKEIRAEIQTCLSSTSLLPYYRGEKLRYVIDQVMEDLDSSILYTLGNFAEGKKITKAMFAIERGWFWNTTKLLYIAKDTPPDPLLFADVCDVATNFLPRSPSSYHVFIEKAQVENEENSQKWTFFQGEEHTEVFVKTMDDGQGGTTFIVFQKDQ